MKQVRLLLIIIVALSGFAGAAYGHSRLDHVEPPFWWVGFKQPKLQILVHGSRIAGYTPKIDFPGVVIKKVIRTKSPNYLFIDVVIAPKTKAGKFNISFIKAGSPDITYPYELKNRTPHSAARKGFNSSDVIYLITPDRFANGNPNNDSVAGMADKLDRKNKDGRHGGDIQGVIDHLDYIARMGFTKIWLTPVLENDQPKTSYHGYAITDFYKVDPRFGSNKLYRKLVQTARRRGIGVIMDMVANHVGSKHWWMNDLPSDDWIHYSGLYRDGKYVITNNRHTTVQDPYSAASDRKIFSDGWFVKTMPDLNQKNPLMANYLIENSLWWIEYAGLSGIRMDTYPYSDMDFMARWSKRIMTEYPDFNIVGEEWSFNPSIVSFWQRGKKNKNGYVSYLPSLMDFPLQNALVKGLMAKESWSTGLITIYRMLANDVVYPNPSDLVIFPDNHDMPRIFTQLKGDKDLFKMVMAFTLTMRGIPEIYYGTEILKASPGPKDDGIIRSDFPGGWAGDKVNAFTGKGLSPDQRAAQQYLRKLLNWRKGKAVIDSGKLRHYLPKDGVYVYFRYNDTDRVMVILNKNKTAKNLKLKRFSEMLKGHSTAHEVIADKTVTIGDNLTLAPRSAMILDIK